MPSASWISVPEREELATIRKNALVGYSAGEMYALVSNVESYPDFLPWCSGAAITALDGEMVRASISIAKGPVRSTFTTVNRLVKDATIEMHLEKGPFHHLDGEWRFMPLGEAGSKISLELNFEFSSRLIAMTIGPVFNNISSQLVAAFVERAEQLYGKR